MDTVSAFNQQAVKTIESLKEDLKSIRTGRASPSLVENLVVETYGGQTKLRLLELATIVTDGPSALAILPFDPSVTQDIEKAILKSPLGLTPAVQGTKIIIRIPTLNTEQREKYVKVVGEKVEEKKMIIRGHRDNARKVIKSSFEKIIVDIAPTIVEFDDYRGQPHFISQSMGTWSFPVLMNGAIFSRFRDKTKRQLLNEKPKNADLTFFGGGSYLLVSKSSLKI